MPRSPVAGARIIRWYSRMSVEMCPSVTSTAQPDVRNRVCGTKKNHELGRSCALLPTIYTGTAHQPLFFCAPALIRLLYDK